VVIENEQKVDIRLQIDLVDKTSSVRSYILILSDLFRAIVTQRLTLDFWHQEILKIRPKEFNTKRKSYLTRFSLDAYQRQILSTILAEQKRTYRVGAWSGARALKKFRGCRL